MYKPFAHHRWISSTVPVVSALLVSVATFSCTQVETAEATTDFEASATTTYTWQVEYNPRNVNHDRPNDRRLERFESTSVTSRNGIRPEAEGSGPDSSGLWWPVLPPERSEERRGGEGCR